MHRQIPSLRTTNSIVPYTYDFVDLNDGNIEWINDCTIWSRERLRWEDPDDVRENRGWRAQLSHEKADEICYELPLKYLRDGTRIRALWYRGIPACWINGNTDGRKLRLSELWLHLHSMSVRSLRFLSPFIDDSVPLKIVKISLRASDLDLLGEPLIATCRELCLGCQVDMDGLRVEDLLRHDNLNQPHFVVAFNINQDITDTEGRNLGVEFVRDLAKHWINNGKPIGCSLTSPCKKLTFITNVFEELQSSLNARKIRISELEDVPFSHYVTVSLNETSEILVYGIEYGKTYHHGTYGFALKMEVKPIVSKLEV